MKLFRPVALLTFGLLFTWHAAFGSSPYPVDDPAINFQGRIEEADVGYNTTGVAWFSLTIGNESFSETYWGSTAAVPVVEGIFSIILGRDTNDAMTDSVFTTHQDAYYLKVAFSTDGSYYEPLSPNQELVCVPFAVNADRLDGLDSPNSAFVGLTDVQTLTNKELGTGTTTTYFLVTPSASAPASIGTGGLWYDSSINALKLNTGSDWVMLTGNTEGSGAPGGADTYVQYNDGGSFGGEAAFTYNTASDTLTAAKFFTGIGSTITAIYDQNDFASDSDAALATQQSIKAYVDSQAGGTWANQSLGNLTGVEINTSLLPKDDGVTVDLGSAAYSFKDAYVDGTSYLSTVDINAGTIDGTVIGQSSAANATFNDFTADIAYIDTANVDLTANIDTLNVNTADINAGTIDNTTIGQSTAAAGAFTNLTGGTVADSSLATAGRVVIAGAAGDLSDDSDLTFSGDTLTATKFFTGIGSTITAIYDEDAFTSNSDTALATQQSIKAYVDASVAGGNWASQSLDNLANVWINTSLLPGSDDSIDLGSSTKEFRALWVDQSANIDELIAGTADINAGTIDGVTINTSTIGLTTPAAGAFTTLTASTSIADTNLTANRVVSTTTGGKLAALGAATDGQLVIGSTGAAPAIASLSTGNGVTSSTGAGTLTVSGVSATTDVVGVLEIATDAEAVAHSATDKAVVPSNLDNVFAEPPDIGLTTAAAGAFTTLTASTSIADTNLTDTYVVYAGAGGVLSGDSNFVYDYSSGSVGINTDSPSAWLEVTSGTASKDTVFLSAGGTGSSALHIEQPDGDWANRGIYINAQTDTQGDGIYIRNDGEGNAIEIRQGVNATATDEALYIANWGTDQSLFIRQYGTTNNQTAPGTSDGGAIHVYNNGNLGSAITAYSNDAAATAPLVWLRGLTNYDDQPMLRMDQDDGANVLLTKNEGTVSPDDVIGQILFDSTDGGVSTVDASVMIRAYASEVHDANNKGGYLTFETKADNTAIGGAALERIRIEAGGDVGIGDSSPDHKLDVAGNIGLDPGSYINFSDVDGTSGYGFRDNSGKIEFKNTDSAGWTDLSSLGAGGATSPGGNDTYVQFNDGGSFGGEDTFVYVKGTNTMTVSNIGAFTLTGAVDAGSQNITNIDIDSGTIDGTTIATSDITVGAGKTLDVSAGTLTLANDQISGDKVEGGTIASITISQLAGAMDANSQAITNVDINSGTIDGTDIGQSTAGNASFTRLTLGPTADGGYAVFNPSGAGDFGKVGGDVFWHLSEESTLNSIININYINVKDDFWMGLTSSGGRFTFDSTPDPDEFSILDANVCLDQGSYLNFTDVGGVNGYGFRDNSGIMEFRNDGGSWTEISGGGGGGTSPGGADAQVQYNNGGVFGGEDAFTWNDQSDFLMLIPAISTGSYGAIDLDNTANTNYGLKVYSNVVSALSPLVKIHTDNTAFNQYALEIISDGSAGTAGKGSVSITQNDTTWGLIVGKTKGGNYGAVCINQQTDTRPGDPSETEGGALHISNSGNLNSALTIYADPLATQAGSLVNLKVYGANFEQPVLKITASSANANHMWLVPQISPGATSNQGEIYADTDGSLYYRSLTAWAPCNSATDFAEVIESVGPRTDYEIGDVIVQSSVPLCGEHSSEPYEGAIVGVVTDRNYKLIYELPENDYRIVVGLIGLVRCKVTNEGGTILPGDKLVTSSTPGHAMKTDMGRLKAWQIVGTAREPFNGDRGMIEILVGK